MCTAGRRIKVKVVEMSVNVMYCLGEVSAAMGLGQFLRKKAVRADRDEHKHVMVPFEFWHIGGRPMIRRTWRRRRRRSTSSSPSPRGGCRGGFSRSYEDRPLAVSRLAPAAADMDSSPVYLCIH